MGTIFDNKEQIMYYSNSQIPCKHGTQYKMATGRKLLNLWISFISLKGNTDASRFGETVKSQCLEEGASARLRRTCANGNKQRSLHCWLFGHLSEVSRLLAVLLGGRERIQRVTRMFENVFVMAKAFMPALSTLFPNSVCFMRRVEKSWVPLSAIWGRSKTYQQYLTSFCLMMLATKGVVCTGFCCIGQF